jgi:hypothetical protein
VDLAVVVAVLAVAIAFGSDGATIELAAGEADRARMVGNREQP